MLKSICQLLTIISFTTLMACGSNGNGAGGLECPDIGGGGGTGCGSSLTELEGGGTGSGSSLTEGGGGSGKALLGPVVDATVKVFEMPQRLQVCQLRLLSSPSLA